MKLVDRWRALDPAWRFALGAYLIARVALSAWSLGIALLFPVVVQNLDLFGAPTLAFFDLATGERYAYSREVDGAALTFRAGDSGLVVDAQTGSVWSLRDGRAQSGRYAGRALSASFYPVEDIFPYRGVAPSQNLLLSVWQRFDTNWYLKIAGRGYSADDGSTVYFPLYPLMVRVVSRLVGSPMLAALLISNLSLVGALALLYRLCESFFDADSARRAVAYLLLFPTGFFLLAAYTESLFLFLALAAFVCARQNRRYSAAFFGALCALTRLQGVLLIVPLAYMLWQQSRAMGDVSRVMCHVSRVTHHASRFTALLLIPLATTAFLTLTNLSLLASYAGELHARFVLPWDNLAASVALLASGQGSFVDALNLLATLGLGAMVFVTWRKLPREYGLYALAMLLAPLFRMTTTQPLVSTDRYALALFPIFALWGAWGRNPWVNRAVVYLSFPLQLYLSAQFVLWGWVG
jgi:hypothetical protein